MFVLSNSRIAMVPVALVATALMNGCAHLASRDLQESKQAADAVPLDEGDAPADSGSDGAAKENASNPLAGISSTDLRVQFFDLDGSDRTDYWVDGAYMLHPKLKLRYELHYWDTDVTGSSESDFETFHLKPIYFPTQGKWGSWKYKTAVGAEWIVSFGNEDQGIGTGSDQIAPLAAVTFARGDTVLVPLLQHFLSYDGPDVNTTSLRLIAIQSLANEHWAKLDAKVPFEWDNDDAIPATAEVQVGRLFSPSFGVYVDGLIGIGGDKPYDWGVGVGIRFNY